ncbi:hypothetical protein N7447_001896 [Penicillium robsamsonii]|uniref:uncharacterized protein n=1 Tax=Penicillium robsamsonii TaxID=1792511 RepID=UPI002546A929|nr:uncharacterized protein N7447_001896 [Penicillium robsamsonii]KAJ5835870.1 hypothetical protein N7447_001896 [Penicillium robsamsonii]
MELGIVVRLGYFRSWTITAVTVDRGPSGSIAVNSLEACGIDRHAKSLKSSPDKAQRKSSHSLEDSGYIQSGVIQLDYLPKLIPWTGESGPQDCE